MSPSAHHWHGSVVLYVASHLDAYVRSKDLGIVSIETDTVIDHASNVVRRPDVFFIAADRIETATSGHLQRWGGFTGRGGERKQPDPRFGP